MKTNQFKRNNTRHTPKPIIEKTIGRTYTEQVLNPPQFDDDLRTMHVRTFGMAIKRVI